MSCETRKKNGWGWRGGCIRETRFACYPPTPQARSERRMRPTARHGIKKHNRTNGQSGQNDVGVRNRNPRHAIIRTPQRRKGAVDKSTGIPSPVEEEKILVSNPGRPPPSTPSSMHSPRRPPSTYGVGSVGVWWGGSRNAPGPVQRVVGQRVLGTMGTRTGTTEGGTGPGTTTTTDGGDGRKDDGGTVRGGVGRGSGSPSRRDGVVSIPWYDPRRCDRPYPSRR